MSNAISVSNISISKLNGSGISGNEDNPVVNCGSIVNGTIDVTANVPFHSNVVSTLNPTINILVSSNGENNTTISPSFDFNITPGKTYAQLLQICFKINNVSLVKGNALINVTIDEDSQPPNNANLNRLRAPKRKTVIIVDGGD